jgi:hypothetical protein
MRDLHRETSRLQRFLAGRGLLPSGTVALQSLRGITVWSGSRVRPHSETAAHLDILPQPGPALQLGAAIAATEARGLR